MVKSVIVSSFPGGIKFRAESFVISILSLASAVFLLSEAALAQPYLCASKRYQAKGLGRVIISQAACPAGTLDITSSFAGTGAKGDKGDTGPQGPKGDTGASAYDVLPSGATIFGMIGGDFESPIGGDFRVTESLNAIIPQALGGSDVIIQNNSAVQLSCSGANSLHAQEIADSSQCTGTAAAPSAPPGKLCIYPLSTANACGLEAWVSSTSPLHGFLVSWSVSGPGDTYFQGVWAYTAP